MTENYLESHRPSRAIMGLKVLASSSWEWVSGWPCKPTFDVSTCLYSKSLWPAAI